MTRPGRRIELLTVWGEQLDPDHPLPEYPRPQLARDSYLNLNGRWRYAFTWSDSEPHRWDGDIVVPFPPEAPLSGVRRVLRPGQVLHYRRTIALPDGFVAGPGDRVLLHLGAVDQWCRVLVDDVPVGEHTGGYLPVSLDVTDALGDGAEHVLRVVVRDVTDEGPLARGKQTLRPGGIWYTPHSGIWQTVWLESVPALHVTAVHALPAPALDAVDVTVEVARDVDEDDATVDVALTAAGEVVARGRGAAGVPVRLPVPDPRLWAPEHPFLYDLEVTVGRDRVRSYVGMRTVSVGPDRQGHPRLLLNGEPYFHAGILDQGYWPDGLCTPPSDDAMRFDIETMKDLGFTMLRKHVKVEPLRWYHHCDRIGVLVWQDIVNGGGRYDPIVVTAPVVVPFRLRDSRYRAFRRADPAGRALFHDELVGTIELLRDSPSVVLWVPFNEGWGQFDAAAVASFVRRLDPTRPVDHASGWHDQGAGDLTSRHVYVRPFRVPRRRRATARRALALTEYGGYSRRVEGHDVGSRSFGYRWFDTERSLAEAFVAVHDRQVVPAIRHGLAATVYTQLSDVEGELNGLLTYDRRVLKVPREVVRSVTRRLRL